MIGLDGLGGIGLDGIGLDGHDIIGLDWHGLGGIGTTASNKTTCPLVYSRSLSDKHN